MGSQNLEKQHKVTYEHYLQSDSVAGRIEACAAFKLPIGIQDMDKM